MVATASDGLAPSFQSRAVGVAHCAASLTMLGDRRARSLGQSPRSESLALGVGQSRIASVSDVPACVLPVLAAVAVRPPDAREPPAVAVGHIVASFASNGRETPPQVFVCVDTPASGVGQKGASVGSPIEGVSRREQAKDPLPPMRRASVACGTEHRVRHPVTHSRQRLSESSQSPKSNEVWDILDEDQGRAGLADDAGEVPDEVAGVVTSTASSRDAVGLTRDAGSDEIQAATPREAVEGGKVRPDRRLSHDTRFHRPDQVGDGENFPLDVQDDARVVAGEGDSEGDAVVSGTKAGGM